MGQQHIGKAPGRAANIHRGHAGRVQFEMLDRMGQLDPPAKPTDDRAHAFPAAHPAQSAARLAILVSPLNTNPASTSALALLRLSAGRDRPAIDRREFWRAF
jgi:hypothetical protein